MPQQTPRIWLALSYFETNNIVILVLPTRPLAQELQGYFEF